MRVVAGLALMLAVFTVNAGTPQAILDIYQKKARETQVAFTASAARGEKFFVAKQSGGKEADRCTACHTEDPKAVGETRAHKRIEPLAPVANPERLTDPKKVEKWFRRNCNDVVGRHCTPQEKADFIAFLISVK